MNILIGINNSGKSNLFRILTKFKINETHPPSFFYEDSPSESAIIEFVFEVSDNILKNINDKIMNNRNPTKMEYIVLGILGDTGQKKYTFKEFFSEFTIRYKFDKERKPKLVYFGPTAKKNHFYNYASTDIMMDNRWLNLDAKKLNFYKGNELDNIGFNPSIISKKQLNNYLSEHPNSIAIRVLYEFLLFLDAIQYISDNRSFSSESNIDVIDTKISSNGNNFPLKMFQFYNIKSKQKNIPHLDLLLKRFYPAIKEIGQELQRPTINSDYKIVPFIHEEKSNDRRKFDQIGKGIHDLVIILTHLLEFDENSILLIEEPETNLHPKMQKILFDIFLEYSSKRQIFISTHSPFLLSKIDNNCSLFHIKKNATQSIVKQISQDDLGEINADLGVSLSDLLLYDKLLFVEGASDEKTLRIWMKKKGFDPNQNHIGFIVMDGVRNYGYYTSGKTLDFLQKYDVKVWFILDRDEQTEEDIKKLQDKLDKLNLHNAELYVLQKRELENYVLNFKTLSRFSELRINEENKQNEKSEYEENGIRIRMFQSTTKLKQLLIDKKMIHDLNTKIYFDQDNIFEKNQTQDTKTRILNEYNRLGKILEKEKCQIDKIYNDCSDQAEKIYQEWYKTEEIFNLSNKLLKIIPGSKILEILMQNYDLTYVKNRDLHRIAEIMDANEIDQEIVDLIIKICNK